MSARQILEDEFDDVLNAAFGPGAQPAQPRIMIGDVLDLLPEMIVENDILPLLNSSLDDSECHKRLLVVLNRFASDLEQGGVLPEYFAWALIAARHSAS